jgi:uncharacterized protein YjlB
MEFVQQDAQVTPHYLKDDGIVPNSAFPLMVYQGVLSLPGDDPARAFEQVFAANCWARSWRNGIYSFHHYHSTAHEVLGIAKGSANVIMGGEQGVRLTIGPGDVMVVPAGVGHKNLGASADLLVVGAYPDGQDPDLCKESVGEHARALENIPRVPMAVCDPIFGSDGPVMRLWKK